MQTLLKSLEEKMSKSVSVLNNEYSSLRAGRASAAVLDKVRVDYYGTPTPINQVGNLSVTEGRCLVIAPWDASMLKVIEKQLLAENLGVTPINDGKVIRLTFPALTEERRKEIVKEVKKVCTKPLIVKLSPNVTDIVSIAKAVEAAGADAISLINTMLGMRINLKTGKPIISIKKGGYSGPGVFPVALRMVYEVSHAVSIPVIGMGGVSNAYEVIEMMYAGASLVMIGAENLVNPYACKDIIDNLERVMDEYKIEKLSDIIGRTK